MSGSWQQLIRQKVSLTMRIPEAVQADRNGWFKNSWTCNRRFAALHEVGVIVERGCVFEEDGRDGEAMA